jgi:hypothetical protein
MSTLDKIMIVFGWANTIYWGLRIIDNTVIKYFADKEWNRDNKELHVQLRKWKEVQAGSDREVE